MRRYLILVSSVAALGLCGCGTNGAESKPAPTQITAPAAKAQSVVNQQNAQLHQMEQQTGSADPTVTP